jgi:hypothetical protein
MTGSKRTTTVLQERDLRLIEALQSMRVVDREQAKVVAGFKSTRRANNRLLQLTQAGFLKRAFVGSRQAVYWLPNEILQRGGKGKEQPHEPAALFLRHRQEINRVHLLVKYQRLPVPNFRFLTWRSFRQPLSQTVPLIPDGYFELGASPQGVRPMFVEVDLGTEAVPILARKARLYLELAKSGEFAKLFGRPQFRVLVITTSVDRLLNIRAQIAKQTDKIFWFTTLAVVKPERFWGAVWLRPVGDQLQTLL